MNWITFIYSCVYVCICDAQHSSVSVLAERTSRKPKTFETQCGVTVVFTLDDGQR